MATSIIPKKSGGTLTENAIDLTVRLSISGTVTIVSSTNISEVIANITGTTTQNRRLNSLTIKPTASLGNLVGFKNFETGGNSDVGVFEPAHFNDPSQMVYRGAKIEVSDGNIVATPLEPDGSAVITIPLTRTPRFVLYPLTGIFE